MTSAAPRGEDDRDLDSMFDQIVSGLRSEMDWDTTKFPDAEETAELPQPPQIDPETERARRRMERAEELAAFNAQKAEAEAEYLSEDGYFVRPDPGPLPRLRRSTIAALAMIVCGLVLFIAPSLLSIAQDLTITLAIMLIVGGGAWLVSKLRPDNEAEEGGDNGARL
ncbi:DUF308 domain-containing protein [Nakamurella silvestris]|nr:DUF308 domain-containing protein [Nakamurella silvestris]